MSTSSIKNSIGRVAGQELIDQIKKPVNGSGLNPFETSQSSIYGKEFKEAVAANNSFDKLDFQQLAFTTGLLAGDARADSIKIDSGNYRTSTNGAEDLYAKKANEAWQNLGDAVSYATASSAQAKDIVETKFTALKKKDGNQEKPSDAVEQINNTLGFLGLEGTVNQGNVNGFTSRGMSINGSNDPLKLIATTKDGFEIKSLYSFFKKAGVAGSEAINDSNWATLSRAMGDLVAKGYKNSDPNLSNQEISQGVARQMVKAAELFKGTEFADNAQAMTFILANLDLKESDIEKLGLDKDVTDKLKEGKDQKIMLGEALAFTPNLLENQEIFNSLKSDISKEISNPENKEKYSHFNTEIKAPNRLSDIYEDMHALLNSDRYSDEISKLKEAGIETNREAVDAIMGELGFTPGGSEYTKVNNADAVAQTFINYSSLKHDHELQKQGSLTDDNRLLSKSADLVVRFTPDNGEDHNGAFNEKNLGRDQMSVMGLNNDQVAQFVIAHGNDESMSKFFDKVSETVGEKITNLDISKHGYSQGAGNIGSNDVALFNSIEKAMAAGGKIVLNSCDCGDNSENGSMNNVAGSMLKKMAVNKGIELDAATESTTGYLENAGTKLETGGTFITPMKLDGATGGVTIKAPDPELLSSKRGLQEDQYVHYINGIDEDAPSSESSQEAQFTFSDQETEQEVKEEKEAEFSFS